MSPHVEDGALVRFLDRECDPDEQAEVRGHMDGCDICSGRLARLDARSMALSAALRALDQPARRVRPAPRWELRAAAAMLVLLGVGGAVRPVRAWIVERAAAIWSALSGAAEVTAPSSPAGESAVSFVPADGPFSIELTARQAAGRLTVEGVAGDTARALVLSGVGEESLVVLPNGLRIVAPPASTADYRILVPSRLGRITVRIGDETSRMFNPGGPPLQIELRNQ